MHLDCIHILATILSGTINEGVYISFEKNVFVVGGWCQELVTDHMKILFYYSKIPMLIPIKVDIPKQWMGVPFSPLFYQH